MSDNDEQLGRALRDMLGDQHLDVRPRSDALRTVLAGADRARRRRTVGYAAVTTCVVAAAVGVITLTGGTTPEGIDPVVVPSASLTPAPTSTPFSDPLLSTPMPVPTASNLQPSSAPPSSAPPEPSSSDSPSEPVEPVLQKLRPDGIGDVVLGASLAEAYGTGTLEMRDPVTRTLAPWDGSPAENVCTPAGAAQRTTPDAALVWMDDSRGVTEIAVWPQASNPEVETVEGLRLFDDSDRIVELYPDARRDDGPNGIFYFVDDWAGSGNALKIRYDLTGGVQGMSVLTPWFGGCYE